MRIRTLLLAAAIAAVAAQVPSRAAGPYIPFHGVAWLHAQPSALPPYTYVDETAGRVNLTYIGEAEVTDALSAGLMQRFNTNGVWFFVKFHHSAAVPLWQLLNNTGGALVTKLTAVKNALHQNGGIARLAGISISEELYAHLNEANPPEPWDYNNPAHYPTLAPHAGNRVAQANALRDLLAARYADVDTVFPNATYPNVNTIHLEYHWYDLTNFGVGYYNPPPANVNVLAMDPYFTGDVIDCGVPNKAAWDSTGPKLYVDAAVARFPAQPIMLVAQSFRHIPPATNGWQKAPDPCQMEWWYQLAMAHAPRIPALLWFSYGYTDSSIPQGVRHPDLVDRWSKMIEIFDRNIANKP